MQYDDYICHKLYLSKVDVLKDIVELFGCDLGVTENTVSYYMDGEKLEGGIIDNLDKFGSNGAWISAVQQMADWYVANIHDYGTATTTCDLVGKAVRHDCSGFTSACLWLTGIDIPMQSSATFVQTSGTLYDKLTENGFQQLSFSWETVQPYDIIAVNNGGPHHVEIYAGKIDGSDKSYAWGSCHDTAHGGLPCYTYKLPYTTIWRCVNAGGMTGGIPLGNFSPIRISSAQAKANGLKLISILMKEFGLAKHQAAAFAGVFMAESGLNPGSFNKAERSGKGVPGQSKKTAQTLAATSGYGAGIAQWTFADRKSKVVAALNRLTGKNYNWQRIENIPFDDQVRMVGATLSTKFINMIKGCSTVDQAVDLVLRGFENGGGGSGGLCSKAAIDRYTWAGGYAGSMKTRVGYAKSFM